MPTTLAQRIKAARSYADLRQQDIADACTAAQALLRLTD